MQSNFKFLVLLSVFIISFACSPNSKEKNTASQETNSTAIPVKPTSIEQTKQTISGKTWKVVDVGLLSGTTMENVFIQWLSEGKLGEYESKQAEQRKDISFEFSMDSVMKSTGKDTGFVGNEYYHIATDENNNINLLIKADSSSIFQMTDVEVTYKVLGVDEKNLLLKTNSRINSNDVVILLEHK